MELYQELDAMADYMNYFGQAKDVGIDRDDSVCLIGAHFKVANTTIEPE